MSIRRVITDEKAERIGSIADLVAIAQGKSVVEQPPSIGFLFFSLFLLLFLLLFRFVTQSPIITRLSAFDIKRFSRRNTPLVCVVAEYAQGTDSPHRRRLTEVPQSTHLIIINTNQIREPRPSR